MSVEEDALDLDIPLLRGRRSSHTPVPDGALLAVDQVRLALGLRETLVLHRRAQTPQFARV